MSRDLELKICSVLAPNGCGHPPEVRVDPGQCFKGDHEVRLVPLTFFESLSQSLPRIRVLKLSQVGILNFWSKMDEVIYQLF